jgi:hypothetical protein
MGPAPSPRTDYASRLEVPPGNSGKAGAIGPAGDGLGEGAIMRPYTEKRPKVGRLSAAAGGPDCIVTLSVYWRVIANLPLAKL